ncbi:hypothetical protein BSL78_06942 [Apostichopus japonicus]|uniref:SCP domain-containing protein n=1 Tax=Stichopus japonicus TaxID=307972 RepID=A0A2G8L7C2_STIJA|nr:hypothetical protein BSL78_06942 [Apostichopus japonicus]
MPFMYYIYVSIQVWDADLALSAQQWADRCQNEHPVARNRDYTNIGQNLFIKADSSAADPPSPVMTPVRSWNSQAKDYTYINNSCAENCAEYKQVIWAETEKVGCGVKYCEVASTRSGTAYQNAWIVVCNYSPRADVIGAKPYIAGVPCSNCPSGMLCRNNVCYILFSRFRMVRREKLTTRIA